jgi:hypothetical protein
MAYFVSPVNAKNTFFGHFEGSKSEVLGDSQERSEKMAYFGKNRLFSAVSGLSGFKAPKRAVFPLPSAKMTNLG